MVVAPLRWRSLVWPLVVGSLLICSLIVVSFISFSNGLLNGSGSFSDNFYSSYSNSFYTYITLYLLSYLFILSLYSIAKKNVIKKEYFVYIFLKNIYKKTPIYIVLFLFSSFIRLMPLKKSNIVKLYFTFANYFFAPIDFLIFLLLIVFRILLLSLYYYNILLFLLFHLFYYNY